MIDLNNISRIRMILSFTFIFLINGMPPSWGLDYAVEGGKCSLITDRVQRLLCFDNLFKTPSPKIISPGDALASDLPVQRGVMQTMASSLEAQRSAGDTGWITRVRPRGSTNLLSPEEYEETYGALQSGDQASQNADVFMTTKQVDVAANTSPAIMMLSCENNITTMAVVLPEIISTLQANIVLSVSGGRVFKLNWRDVENGSVVIAGRGLESIGTIKTIANYSRVLLQLYYPNGIRSFVFDIGNLKDRLKPLRTACHWQGER